RSYASRSLSLIAISSIGLDAKDFGHDALKLDLDVLRERHLFSKNQPQFIVEFGRVERAIVMTLVPLVLIPAGKLAGPPYAQPGFTAVGRWRAMLIEGIRRPFRHLHRWAGIGQVVGLRL